MEEEDGHTHALHGHYVSKRALGDMITQNNLKKNPEDTDLSVGVGADDRPHHWNSRDGQSHRDLIHDVRAS